MYFSPLNCSDCFVVIFFSFYFLNALQKDITSNRVYVLGHKYLPGVLKTGFPEVLSRIQLIAGNLSGHNLLKAVTFLG